MRAVDVVLETLAHFIKQEAGPPPGIPVRVEQDFERKLVRLCEGHAIAPLLLDSLEKLALQPPLSQITFERLKALARASSARNERFIAAFRSLSQRLRERRVPALLLDDTMAALKLYPRHRLRPIESIDLLIRENDWDTFIGACRGLGYRRAQSDPNFLDGKEAMLFHQHFTPCVLRGDKDVSIGVKFRLIDVGYPSSGETAWSLGKRLGRDIEAMRVSYEDQLVRSCFAFNMTGFGRLLHAVDAARIIARHDDDLDWPYIEGLARDRSFYPALYFSYDSILKIFGFPPKRRALPHPNAVRKKVFEIIWRPGHMAVLADRSLRVRRYRFAFLEIGTPGEQFKALKNVLTPRKDWVSTYFGKPYRPWYRWKYVFLALRNRLAPAPPEPKDARST